jgi:hypothetical protein
VVDLSSSAQGFDTQDHAGKTEEQKAADLAHALAAWDAALTLENEDDERVAAVRHYLEVTRGLTITSFLNPSQPYQPPQVDVEIRALPGLTNKLEIQPKTDADVYPALLVRAYDTFTHEPAPSVFITWLRHDGSGRAPITIKTPDGDERDGSRRRYGKGPAYAWIRRGSRMVTVGEGLETTLSLAGTGAALFTMGGAGLASFIAPPGVQHVTIAVDNDSNQEGLKKARVARARMIAAGVEVTAYLPPDEDKDFNDTLRRIKAEGLDDFDFDNLDHVVPLLGSWLASQRQIDEYRARLKKVIANKGKATSMLLEEANLEALVWAADDDLPLYSEVWGIAEQKKLLAKAMKKWRALHQLNFKDKPVFINPLSADDFYAYMPKNNFIFAPTIEMWPAESVNTRVPPVLVVGPTGKKSHALPSVWLRQHRAVEQLTWAPVQPPLIENRLIADGGWIEKDGVKTFNIYRPPASIAGDPRQAGKWRDHLERVYPNNIEHITCWFAHHVQRPGVKVNHSLVMGGDPNIGKDTIIEPLCRGVGPWNFADISPHQMLTRWNVFARSIVVRISEARDLGEYDRYAFYERSKIFMAAPPEVLYIDEKHLGQYYIPNCCGAIITTNHKLDGIYLPANDRRHYVAWSDCVEGNFSEEYWKDIWNWYEKEGGFSHVVAYLKGVDLGKWNPKAPPRKTEAFWMIVNAQRSPEDSQMSDILEQLGNPEAVLLRELIDNSWADFGDFGRWLQDHKNRRKIPYTMERCEYESLRNENAKDGRWKIKQQWETVYVKKSLSFQQRLAAVAALKKKLEMTEEEKEAAFKAEMDAQARRNRRKT